MSFPLDTQLNILPCDGEVYYYQNCFSPDLSDLCFVELYEGIDWKHDSIRLFGKTIETKRRVAWYGDVDLKYTYSGTTKVALPWNSALQSIREKVEKTVGYTFNACLLNLYTGGEEGMSWHSDNEKELGDQPVIASVSFGAKRKFVFKHKQTKVKQDIELSHGSLLLMKGATQKYWLHSLPTTKKHIPPRINLTFRTILGQT